MSMRARNRDLTRAERRERKRLSARRHKVSGRSVFTIAAVIASRAAAARRAEQQDGHRGRKGVA
ncbi:MAG: hypothetical protein RMK67_02595 [Chloroflexota bacterium]|nr:hypothetical protein [Chloroflexota bacterium]